MVVNPWRSAQDMGVPSFVIFPVPEVVADALAQADDSR
jgi:hypothetical protein